MRILTTHSDKNPLVLALRDGGVGVEFATLESACRHQAMDGFAAFYGNLFTEIKYPLALLKLKNVLRANHVPYLFWNRDAPWNVGMKRHRRYLIQWLKPVDIYLTHSMQNADWFSAEAHFFPNAAHARYYETTDLNALRDESAYDWDVSFFGAVGNKARRQCRERSAFFAAVGAQLQQALPGIRFCVVDTFGKTFSLDEQLQLIRTTKINLNYGAMCDLPGNPSWGLPERVFGIPAAGGFLLTDHRRSLNDAFSDEAYDSYEGVSDCVAKIVHGLKSFAQLRQRAEALHRQVLDRHTYARRAAELVSVLERYRSTA